MSSRREQLERLLADFDPFDERMREASLDSDDGVGAPITYDTAFLRRELGLA